MELAFFWSAGIFYGNGAATFSFLRLLVFYYTKKIDRMGGAVMGRDREAPQPPLTAREELLIKAAKEIVVKFIEVGRVSPASFADTFKMVIDALRQSLKG
jgi:hypothetical protein